MAYDSLSWKNLSLLAKVFIGLMVAAGTGVLFYCSAWPTSSNLAEFLCYLGIAILASRFRVALPGIAGTISVNFLIILLAIMELSLSETVLLACVSVLVQCWSRRLPNAIRITFNVSAASFSSALAYFVYHYALFRLAIESRPLLLGVAAVAYFIAHTGSVAVAISLTEMKPLRKVFAECYLWLFPYYLVGAAVVAVFGWFNRLFYWQTSLLMFPVIYLFYGSYRLYLSKLENEKRHVDEMSALHLRTIEALAVAIEAKDQNTHDHLRRVSIYALEVAKELNISGSELDALHAATLLHDIGKLAVPEHIISKPGRLTPEEFEKMKIHPIVGAEILERVQFPYPVVPIVRAHHEKWDGSGYPAGLKGDAIPIGARILSAVDFLDAQASDRQYRRALPMGEVMRRLSAESGKAFDPKVVSILERRHRQMEQLVAAKAGTHTVIPLSTDAKIERGEAPGAGFASDSASHAKGQASAFLSSIASARQEAQTLFELSQELGISLSLGETLSVLSVKLKPLVPYDAIAIYIRRDQELVPEYVNGDNFRLFSSLRIPWGQGLSGWVAENRKPIVNGNPSVEPGYLNDPSKYSTLGSALAVPLEGVAGVIGVLALYRSERDAFTNDHLRVLLAISSKMALTIENALKYQQAESSATTDYLTGLPNARSLFLQLEREVARSKRDKNSLTIMVCDMDGFKQVNDRFGHLEGNRVLRLFAQALKQSCREYDYVARMGGDEFVVVAPGLSSDAAGKRATQLRELARRAGMDVCGEDILSLSVGQAVYPKDGGDAENLLAEADRRMYVEKQKQPSRRDRRLHTRFNCRLTIELVAEQAAKAIFAHVTNISLGGCYVETSAIMSRGSKIRIDFADSSGLQLDGTVERIDPGLGMSVQFIDVRGENREKIRKVLDSVRKDAASENPYLEPLSKR